MAVKRWFNNTGSLKQIDQSTDTVHYDYWFTTIAHTPITGQVLVASGLPTTGDTVFWDSGSTDAADLIGESFYWTGVTFAANQTVYLSDSIGGGLLNLDATSVIGIGTSFVFSGSAMALQTGAVWLGDAVVTFTSDCIIGFVNFLAGWGINNNMAGGSIVITDNSSGQLGNIFIDFPNGEQSPIFKDIILGNAVGISSDNDVTWYLNPIELSGIFQYPVGNFLTFPSGTWITLIPPGGSPAGTASALGVTTGYVPLLSSLITTDDLFGAAGTYVTVTASEVKNGVSFGPSGSLTGILTGGAPVGIVVSG